MRRDQEQRGSCKDEAQGQVWRRGGVTVLPLAVGTRRRRSVCVALRGRCSPRAMQDARCIPVTTHFIGLGSLTAQCRQQVNTPCRMPLHAPAYMDVQETFFDSFLASTKKEFACRGETRPDGSAPHQPQAAEADA